MAFELGDNDNGGMNEIHLIPLTDIMLVDNYLFGNGSGAKSDRTT